MEIRFTPEELREYVGLDIHQKFPGEDDLVWCARCKTNHRRGAGFEIERQRLIEKMAAQIAARIEEDALETLRRA